MKSAFSSLHPLDSSPSTRSESEWRRKRRRRTMRGVTRQKKRGQKSHGGASVNWRVTQKHIHAHTLADMEFLLLSITHTASALRSCRCVFCFHTHQSRSNERKEKQDTKGKKQKKLHQEVAQGLVEWQKSRHSEGRTQRKIWKKKKEEAAHNKLCSPTFLLHWRNGNESPKIKKN